MYEVAAALTVFAGWALLRALRGGARLRAWLLYALLATLLAYTHYFGLYTLVGHAVFTIFFLLRKARYNLIVFFRLPEVWDALSAAALVSAAWLPWLRVFLHQEEQVRHSAWAAPVTVWDLAQICYRMFAIPEFVPRPARESTLFVAVPCVLGLILLCRKARGGDWLVLCSALSPFVLCVIASKLGTEAVTLRYFVMAQAFFLIALAALVFRIPFLLERSVIAAALLAAFVFVSVESYQAMDLPNRPGARAAADFVLRQRRPGEPVIVSSPLYYDALFYHGKKPANFFIYSDGNPILRYHGTAVLTPEELISQEQIERLVSRRVWVVNMASQYWGTKFVPVPPNWTETSTNTFPDLLGVGDFHIVEYQPRGERPNP
jgi:hypothetical protein